MSERKADRTERDDAREFRACGGCVCLGMRRAARAITQHYDRLLRPTGLRVTQFSVLATLAALGPMPINRLASRLGLDRTTLTRNLQPIEANGWVSVTEDDDRRVRTVAITARGRTAVRGALPAWREAQATAGAKLAALEVRDLLASVG